MSIREGEREFFPSTFICSSLYVAKEESWKYPELGFSQASTIHGEDHRGIKGI